MSNFSLNLIDNENETNFFEQNKYGVSTRRIEYKIFQRTDFKDNSESGNKEESNQLNQFINSFKIEKRRSNYLVFSRSCRTDRL